MENHRKEANKNQDQNQKKEKRSRNAGLIMMIRLSFIEFAALGWCWLGPIGFDKYGNIYGRKKAKD